jgi:diguanylate cyclase (GGDEF)-like protein
MVLVGGAILMLGVAVFARERANSVTWSFLTLTICIALWLFPTALVVSTHDPAIAFAFARITYIGVALIPAAVLQFTAVLVGMRNRAVMIATWGLGVVFAALFVTNRWMLSGVWHYGWGFYPRLEEPAALFLAYFSLVLALSLVLLATGETQSDRERRRNASFFIALSVGYLGSVDYLPAFGLDIYPGGSAAILGFVVLATIAIFRFQLMDLGPSFIADHLLLTMHGGVLVVDTRARVKVANDFAAKLLGYSVEEIRELDLLSLLNVGRLPATDTDSFIRHAVTRERVVQWKRRDGSSVELCLSASAVRDQGGDPLGVVYVISDVSATHDMLTAIPNRTRFAAIFEESKKKLVAAGRVPAVLFIDLDGFKSVNDRLGHAAGDKVLQLVAKRIRRAIRGEDIVARYGGDEFVVLADLAKASDANFVAAKLLRVVGEPYTVADQYVTIGASIGCSFYPADGETVEDLLRAADYAMYDAKRSGKGRASLSRSDHPAPSPLSFNATA